VNPARLSANSAAAKIKAGELSSETLVQACLDRVSEREPQVRAWSWLDADAALAQARACDRAAGPQGPLHGVPIGVKDVIDTADMPTAYGSAIYKGYRPRADAACVSLARAAGAVILGKTETAEFASIHPAATRNPHALAHTPGGSSSGSAAAVADFMVPLALGTQTGGSTIRPAAFCGVVGYKPSFNRVNRAGLKFSAESLDTIGFFARSVEDTALLAHVMSGQERLGKAELPKDKALRIGLCRTSQWSQASTQMRGAIEDASQRLAAAGANVELVALPPAFDDLHAAHAVIIQYEAARATAWEYRVHRDLLSPAYQQRMRAGLAIPHERYQAALRQAESGRQDFSQVLGELDVLITPSAVDEAPLGLESTGDTVFNRLWTLLGVPCVHLPLGIGTSGLPLGLQVVGRRQDDVATLVCARWIEDRLRSF
jgi:Asp-tRNA(Asn)/Glu-tRNA(Gln) amidotransferase A subunit family amidase